MGGAGGGGGGGRSWARGCGGGELHTLFKKIRHFSLTSPLSISLPDPAHSLYCVADVRLMNLISIEFNCQLFYSQ